MPKMLLAGLEFLVTNDGFGFLVDAKEENLVGREPIQIVEIRQPFCNNTFGVAPCTATGTDDEKCYNTYATCLDKANFSKGSKSLWFHKGEFAGKWIGGANVDYAIPSLVSVSTASSQINLSGADPDKSGLGSRALATIVFADHPHTDRVVDPYLSGRSWDAYQRGSFWTKWRARNKFRNGIPVIIYEGYNGQSVDGMKKREYVMESLQGPGANGRVTIRCKDILAKAEERKAQAPALSPGRLYADIDATQTSIEVEGATTSDYPASGTLRIDNEVMTYSSVATSTNGITFTISARGTDGSTASTHKADALVQECLRYTDKLVDYIVADLLTTYAGIPSGYLDTANWATEASTYLAGFVLSTLITEPISVAKLVAEIAQDTGCYFWWDERASLIKMAAIHGIIGEPPLLTEESHIVAGTFRMRELPRQRLSEVWLYFGKQDPTESDSKTANYRYAQIQADLASESENEYGDQQIKTIKSRWLKTTAQALSTTSKIITRYRDVPRECVFEIDAKDRDKWIGSVIRISHHLDVDAFGNRNIANWFVIAAEEVDAGHRVRLTAQDITLYGRVALILAAGHADYQGDGTDPYNGAFIGDASGLLSDGTNCARVA